MKIQTEIELAVSEVIENLDPNEFIEFFKLRSELVYDLTYEYLEYIKENDQQQFDRFKDIFYGEENKEALEEIVSKADNNICDIVLNMFYKSGNVKLLVDKILEKEIEKDENLELKLGMLSLIFK